MCLWISDIVCRASTTMSATHGNTSAPRAKARGGALRAVRMASGRERAPRTDALVTTSSLSGGCCVSTIRESRRGHVRADRYDLPARAEESDVRPNARILPASSLLADCSRNVSKCYPRSDPWSWHLARELSPLRLKPLTHGKAHQTSDDTKRGKGRRSVHAPEIGDLLSTGCV